MISEKLVTITIIKRVIASIDRSIEILNRLYMIKDVENLLIVKKNLKNLEER